jgi:hypothetical protein
MIQSFGGIRDEGRPIPDRQLNLHFDAAVDDSSRGFSNEPSVDGM